jgi:hypothetical protein
MLKTLEKLPLRIVVLCFFLASLAIFAKPLFFNYYPDFSRSYYQSALILKEGGNPYTQGEDKFLSRFSYPPAVLQLFIPFTYISPVLAGRIFATISFSAYLLSMFLLIKIGKLKPFSNTALLLYALGFNFFPAKFTLGMGQINNLILLLMVLFLYLKKQDRRVLSGTALALAISIKIFPAILILGLFVEKEWKVLISCLWALLIITLYPLLIIDRTIFLYFFQKVILFFPVAAPAEYYNQSLAAFLVKQTGNISLSLTIRNIVLVISVPLFITIARRFKKLKSIPKEMLYSYLIVLGLLLNGVSWQHHFVWLIISLFTVYFYLQKNKLDWKYYLLLLTSFALTAYNIKVPTKVSALFLSHVTYGALLLLVLISYLIFTDPLSSKTKHSLHAKSIL